MRLVPVLVLVALLCLPHPAAAVDDAALVNQLVAGSPWKGENIGERGMGSVTYDVASPRTRAAGSPESSPTTRSRLREHRQWPHQETRLEERRLDLRDEPRDLPAESPPRWQVGRLRAVPGSLFRGHRDADPRHPAKK